MSELEENHTNLTMGINDAESINVKIKKTRSEALKKAQKKYYDKIKEENSEVYQKLRERNNEYQKTYIRKKKENNVVYCEEQKKKNRVHAKTFYYKNKERILNQRKLIRDKKKDEYLEEFLNSNIKEISFDV